MLTWFIPAQPLRETVAAASSSAGKDAGDAFAMPGTGDPAFELLRGLTILADRDAQRAYVKSITDRAGLDLMPVSAWMLLRLGEDATATPDAIAREHGIPPARKDEGLAQLNARGYLVPRTGAPSSCALTAAGCAAYDRLADARRARLRELSAQWPESQRRQLALVLQRFAREIVPSRIA